MTEAETILATEPPPAPSPAHADPPKRVTAPRMVVDLEEVDAALMQCQGNRKAAGTLLKIGQDKLKSLIHDNPMLRDKWSREGINNRAKELVRQQLGLPTKQPERACDKAMSMLIDLEHQTLFRMNKLLMRMEKTADRLDKGEEARFSSDPEFVSRHGFKWDANGAPQEEKMLRQNFVEMGKLAVMIKAECRETLWTVHKMEFMDKKYQSNPMGPRKAKAGFGSKADMMTRVERMSQPGILADANPLEAAMTK